MNYKKLINFQKIFNRPDFNHISDHKNIINIERVFSNISNPDGEESEYKQRLEEFSSNLRSFYEAIAGHNIPDMKKGYSKISEVFETGISLLYGGKFERTALSKGYGRKFKKTFLYGLSKLFDGIRAAFDPILISSTRIDRQQFIRYILDPGVGLARSFLFNTLGHHSFVHKIDDLNMRELIVTVRLLVSPSGNQIRTFNKWRDLGLGHTPVRILCEHHFRKDKVYFLYRLNEHGAYQNQLNTPPKRVPFSAA